MPISPAVLADLRDSDRFLVSFPRSGNTWLRHLLQELIILRRPDQPRPPDLESLQPSIHRGAIERPATAAFNLPWRLLKSHNIRDLRGRRMIYLFRRPADALVSLFHLRTRKRDLPAHTSLEEFCREALPDWCEHMRLGLEHFAAFPGRTHLIAYEQLKADAPATLWRVARFVGLETSDGVIAAAVEACEFEHLRAREQGRKPLIAAKGFFRKGTVGGGAEELDPELLEEIERVAGGLYRDAFDRAQQSRG